MAETVYKVWEKYQKMDPRVLKDIKSSKSAWASVSPTQQSEMTTVLAVRNWSPRQKAVMSAYQQGYRKVENIVDQVEKDYGYQLGEGEVEEIKDFLEREQYGLRHEEPAELPTIWIEPTPEMPSSTTSSEEESGL